MKRKIKRFKHPIIISICIAVLFAIFLDYSSTPQAGDLLSYPKFRAKDSNDDPLNGGKLHTYIAGTTTNKASYSEKTCTTANANPVVLDSNGEADVYLCGTYKLVLKDSDDVTLWTLDNIEGGTASFDDYRYPDSNATDQGVTGDSNTIKYYVDDIGATKTATIFLRHNSGSDTTTYTLSTAETITSNITLEFAPGALLSIDSGVTATVSGPLKAELHQIKSGSGIFALSGGVVPEIYPEWWYTGSGSWDTAIESAIESTWHDYADNTTTEQGGTVSLAPRIYSVTDTITIRRPVRLRGEFHEISSGPSRGSRAGTRIVSAINDTAKDVIELVGFDRGDGNNAILGTTLENFAISGVSTERDGIRVSASGYIYGLILSNIDVYNVLNNGFTITSDNDGLDYSTFRNIRAMEVGGSGVSIHNGGANFEGVGLRIVDGKSSNSGAYGVYLQARGVHVDNFTEDNSGSTAFYLDQVQHSTFRNIETEDALGNGWFLNASSLNTFIHVSGTRNILDQFYLAGNSIGNTFIMARLDQVGSENHITYVGSGDRNNTWISPQFSEAKVISDSGSRNVYLFSRVATDGNPQQVLATGGENDVLYFDTILGTVREPFSTKTGATYTLTSTDKYIWMDATAADSIASLPIGATILRGQNFTIKKVDASGNTVHVLGDGASIEGISSGLTLYGKYDYIGVQWSGSEWYIISGNSPFPNQT